MNYLKLVLPAILLTVASFGANASLVEQGDITVDSATGLQWLDLSESVGRSYQDITTQFGTGGDFEGYRYATRDETMQLFTNAGISGVVNGYQSINYQPITDFIGLFGGNRGMYDWVVSTSVQTWLMLVDAG